MSTRPHSQLYRDFVDFVRSDVQQERSRVNRRMFNAFFWCFLVPALTSAVFLFMIRFKILPRNARGFLDWTVLVFPVLYSLYVFSSEVLSQTPTIFRRGGTSNVLEQSLKDTAWRERVCAEMARAIQASSEDWRWILASYRIDLQAIQNRTRYLTALAGAVFFLILQGIDTLGDVTDETPAVMGKNPLMGWLETSSHDFSQIVALALFLLLLYLSGSQTYQSLARYLDCAELTLLAQQKGDRRA